MEIEKAIEYFEDAIKESDEIIEDCSPVAQAELLKQTKHFIVGLAALERQKGKTIETHQDGGETVYKCPSCAQRYTTKSCVDFCLSCGQHLSWELEGQHV